MITPAAADHIIECTENIRSGLSRGGVNYCVHLPGRLQGT
jgi:hypothetical protein